MKNNAFPVIRYSLIAILICLLLAIPITGCAQKAEEKDTRANQDSLYQVSIYGALEKGLYDGDTDFGTVKGHGDFGLGTFNGLDGEMVALDGEYYQVKTDGKTYPVSDSSLTPFADVTFFSADSQAYPPEGLDYSGLRSYLDGLLPSPNILYAIRVEGRFSYVKARSVPAQSKPYAALTDAIKNQTVFEYDDIEGTMVGFWCPSYTGNVCVPAYHLHFLTGDRQAGGHVLDLRLGAVTVSIDDMTDLQVQLPQDEAFYGADLQNGAGK